MTTARRGKGQNPSVFVNGKVRRTIILHPATDAAVKALADEAKMSPGAFMRAAIEKVTNDKERALAESVVAAARVLIDRIRETDE